MKKVIASLIFLVAAFFGAGTLGNLYGDISLLLSFVIVIVSLSLMGFAVSLWKSSNIKDNKQKD